MKLTSGKILNLKNRLKEALCNKLGFQIESIDFAANGVDNAVFLVREKDKGKLAVRVPWMEDGERMDENESGILSLKKEAELSAHCYHHGFPVPRIHNLSIDDEMSFLVSDFIQGDAVPISSFHIGEMIAQLHRLPVEGMQMTFHNESFSQILSSRIVTRANAIQLQAPPALELQKVLNQSAFQQSLLHLDVRPPNLIGQNGRIAAMIDWDNALIGDPVMELMRIAESKEIIENEFLQGYKNDSMLKNCDEMVQTVYRLDTAVMLAILFSVYIKNNVKRDYYVQRVKSLIKKIDNGM
ncbi:aminoglycoside phosphotransferase family protein [Cytobacillus horneckiae]|uniref:phosphotransferase family protein n=1 Tax=Cytobacillus horneckiae TaxID=549687 RepID=UPI0039A3A9BC